MTRRNVQPLDDAALDHQLRRALSVEPSPELLARVRQRIAEEPPPPAWSFSWAWVGAPVAVTAILVLGMVVWNRTAAPVRSPAANVGVRDVDISPEPVRTVDNTSSSPASATAPLEDSTQRHVAPRDPEVLVPREEVELIRRLVNQARYGYVESGTSIEAPSAAAPLEPLTDITISPVSVEPLAPVGD